MVSPWFIGFIKYLSVCVNVAAKFVVQKLDTWILHCVKSVRILSFFWSLFSCILTEYGYLKSESDSVMIP